METVLKMVPQWFRMVLRTPGWQQCLQIQHIISSLLYIQHNVIVCAHGYVQACKISETKKCICVPFNV